MSLGEGPLPPHPLCASPRAVGFVVLDISGVHGAKTFIEHFHRPFFRRIRSSIISKIIRLKEIVVPFLFEDFAKLVCVFVTFLLKIKNYSCALESFLRPKVEDRFSLINTSRCYWSSVS